MAGSAIKLYRKTRRTTPSPKKKEKEEYFNYEKKGYFAREYRLIK
jgi:hypothetical protein